MSINLVSLISQFLTPEMVGRIATALGVDRTLLGKAATALAPALLRMLAGLASTPVGARRLAGVLEEQDPGLLNTLESAIGGTGQPSLVKDGIGALESLVGGSAVSGLAGAINKFTGLGESAGSSLIGMLTPAVLGTVRKEQAAQGLDASGLAQLLAAQKENISAALPAEFGDLLGKAGVPGFASAVQAPQAERPAPRVERPPVARAAPVEEEAPRSSGWLPWAIAAAAALAVLGWWYSSQKPAEPVQQAKNVPSQVVQNLTVDGVDLRSSIQTAFAGLRSTLQGVTDAGSAQAVLPQLNTSGAEFDKLRDLAGKLPIDAKSALGALVTSLRPSVEELFNKVLAIPGVAAIAKPVIDGLRAKLDALSKAESKA